MPESRTVSPTVSFRVLKRLKNTQNYVQGQHETLTIKTPYYYSKEHSVLGYSMLKSKTDLGPPIPCNHVYLITQKTISPLKIASFKLPYAYEFIKGDEKTTSFLD